MPISTIEYSKLKKNMKKGLANFNESYNDNREYIRSTSPFIPTDQLAVVNLLQEILAELKSMNSKK